MPGRDAVLSRERRLVAAEVSPEIHAEIRVGCHIAGERLSLGSQVCRQVVGGQLERPPRLLALPLQVLARGPCCRIDSLALGDVVSCRRRLFLLPFLPMCPGSESSPASLRAGEAR